MLFGWVLDVPPLFPQRGLDFESAIVDLNFANLHDAFCAMIPMVRRTSGFGAAKSILKTNWILAILCCGLFAGTKYNFQPRILIQI